MAEAKLIAKMMSRSGYGYALQIAVYGQLGRHEEARPLITKFLEVEPEFGESHPKMWLIRNLPKETVDRYREGLLNAGLDVPDKPKAAN